MVDNIELTKMNEHFGQQQIQGIMDMLLSHTWEAGR